jgi:phage tail-like protein
MAPFPADPTGPDPYRLFSFRLKWDGREVAAFSKVSGLDRTAEVVQHRSGGDPSASHKSPGRRTSEAITLERGVSHDIAFQAWASRVWTFAGDAAGEASPTDLRKDICLEVYDEAGRLVMRYEIHRCRVSEYEALPDLDAGADAVAIQHIKLETEGWRRDTSVTEPQAPTL